MKKILYSMLLFASIFASCKNTQGGDKHEAIKHKVTFEVFNKEGGSITASIKGGGALTTSPSMVEEGKTLIFKATPNGDYKVEKWLVNNKEKLGEKGPSIEVKLEKDLSVKVIFEKIIKTHKVTFEVSNKEGGSLSASIKGGGALTTSPSMVEEGKTVVFNAKPNADYKVEKWLINDKEKTDEKDKTSIEVKVEKELDVKVVFKNDSPQTHQLTFEVDGEGGSITAEDYDDGTPITSSPATVNHGKHVMFSATSNNDYKIKQWTHDGSVVNGVAQGYDVVVDKDTVVKVSFEKKADPPVMRQVTFGVEGNLGGEIKATLENGTDLGASPVSVANKTLVIFKAKASEGYEIESWSRNGSVLQGKKDDTYRLSIGNNVNILVKFKAKPVDKVKVKFSVEGGNGDIEAKIDDAGVALVSGSDGAEIEKGKTVVFTAKPNINYIVEKWIKDGSDVAGETGLKYTLSNITSNVEVKVKFKSNQTTQSDDFVLIDLLGKEIKGINPLNLECDMQESLLKEDV